MAESNRAKPSIGAAVARAIRLRCPRCGKGHLFRTWFLMHERCSECGLTFDRGPGYYLGSIYINYGLTAFCVVGGWFALYLTDILSPVGRLVVLAFFCVLFPIWFFRYARGLWLALDLYFDPDQTGG